MTTTKGSVIRYVKCVKEEIREGQVVGVYFKGTPQEYYDVKGADGKIESVQPKAVISSQIAIRGKKTSKPKTKKSCGCK